MITKCSRCGTETYEGSTHFCTPPRNAALSQASDVSDEEAYYEWVQRHGKGFGCSCLKDDLGPEDVFRAGIQHGRLSERAKQQDDFAKQWAQMQEQLEQERARSAKLLSAAMEVKDNYCLYCEASNVLDKAISEFERG